MKKNKFSCIAGIAQIFIISLLFHGCVIEVPSPIFIEIPGKWQST